MTRIALLFYALMPGTVLANGLPPLGDVADTGLSGAPAIYPTFGIHNPPQYSPCPKTALDCLNRRMEGVPSDPLYPQFWTSDWIMYRVFDGYQDNPPPYTSPPSTLRPDQYEVSEGTTYYDSTYQADAYPDSGAMMEYYKKRCLPIFPIDNKFSCAFISLGKTAYFLTYPEDRPQNMPACCLFSPENHPPRRDFVKHLPYSAPDSARIDDIQAYSLTTPGPDGSPILFGYAFESQYRTDPDMAEQQAYRHPYAFYFSGSPESPPDAPIVTQNYTNFSALKPDPASTWELVGQMCTGDIPDCELFNPSDQ